MSRTKRIWVLVCCLLVIAVAVTAVTVCLIELNMPKYRVQVQLQGERIIQLEYGTSFEDPGATAAWVNQKNGKSTAMTVTASGSVDADNIGSYTLCYKASKGGSVGTAYRLVRVVDTQAPVITLVADPENYTLPGTPYEEEGYTAIDNYDGDITDRVQRKEENGIVIYTVSDSFGNTAVVTRTIQYRDTVPPELLLQGESLIVLDKGTDYVEPGYTAQDNEDGDLTAAVKISGSVDTNTAGRYTLVYEVADGVGNTTRCSRTVFVKETGLEHFNDPSKADKVIYLTFDDGPGANTPKLLDVLEKYNVLATFFVVDTAFISTIQQEAEAGHTVAIHTATHNFSKIYASEEAYFEDLYKMQEIIKEYTGQTANLIRFPGGSSNTVSSFNKGIMTRLTKLVEEKGFVYFDWNVDSMDAGGAKTAKQVFNNVTSGIGKKQTAVVLMHDIKSYTIEAIEDIIVWGLENGYTFLPLTEDSPTFHHGLNN